MPDSFIMNVKQEMPPLVAKIYAAQVAEGSREVYERFIDEFLPKIPNPKNLIDVGCGPGHVCELLATRFPEAQFTGIDVSDTLIAIAQQKRKKLSNLKLTVGNEALYFDMDEFLNQIQMPNKGQTLKEFSPEDTCSLAR